MNKKKATASMLGAWIAIGVAIGVVTHQLAIWIPIGVAIGAVSAGVARRKLNGNAGPNE